MKPDSIPPLTDELIARFRQYAADNNHSDLTTVLHHLEAYRDAVERYLEKKNGCYEYEREAMALKSLSAVHARTKGAP